MTHLPLQHEHPETIRRLAFYQLAARNPALLLPGYCALSPRRRQVLKGRIEGKDYEGIAGELTIARDTVRSHVHELSKRMGGQTDFASLALGWLEAFATPTETEGRSIAMAHVFTRDERQRGGWERVRQQAEARRANPTQTEENTRRAVDGLGLPFAPEFEIVHDDGQPQFIDILCDAERLGLVAIEVDGSNGWHDAEKMAEYDAAKRAWCAEAGIEYLMVPKHVGMMVVRVASFLDDNFLIMARARDLGDWRTNGKGAAYYDEIGHRRLTHQLDGGPA